ncbi:unnamed protein product, partial [Ectocarpus sp. 8 AP-2014]
KITNESLRIHYFFSHPLCQDPGLCGVADPCQDAHPYGRLHNDVWMSFTASHSVCVSVFRPIYYGDSPLILRCETCTTLFSVCRVLHFFFSIFVRTTTTIQGHTGGGKHQ